MLLAFGIICQGQTIYYVASTGSDINDGLSEASPLQSLAKVNTLLVRPGDAVLFSRGDTFRGRLLINRSGTAGKPVRYGAYGSGSKPVLSGAVPVRNWVKTGANRWQAACPDCGDYVTGLYKNNRAQPLGRYPNSEAPDRGQLTILSHVGNNKITSKQDLTTNWTGGELVVRTQYWIIDRALITSQHANTIMLNNPSTYSLTDSWGFFIQNHPATLDLPGEWYYDPVKQVLQLYSDQENPNDQSYTATALDEAVRIADAAYVTVQDLCIAQARTVNLHALNVSNLTLTNNAIVDAGEDALLIEGKGSDILIDRNTIARTNNNGVNIAGYQDVIFRANTIRQTAIQPGRGRRGDGQYTGFQSADVQRLLIEHNVIDSVGYSAISVQNNTTIRQNMISNFCMTKCDGGGIYLWNGKRLPMNDVHIQANIIRYGIGTPGALVSTIPGGAHGIFLDDCVEGTEVTDNTVSDCEGFGIYLHAVSNVSLMRNTCLNNSAGQLSLYNYGVSCIPRGNVISQNVLVAKTATQLVACFESGTDDLARFGQLGENYYARPFHDEFSIRAVYNRTVGSDISLLQWQTQFKHDFTSKKSPLTFRDYRVKSLLNANYLDAASTTKSGGWENWSLYNNGQVSWAGDNTSTPGRLTIGFSTITGKADAYLLTYKGIRPVKKAKSYLVSFAVAAPAPKKVAVFMRQRQAPYRDLTRRYEFIAEPDQKRIEFALTVTDDELDALLAFQVSEDQQPVWLSDIQLREATIEPVNPDDYIRLVYNPTIRDSTVTLSEAYRDVHNRYYSRQILLKPYGAAVILRDTLPPADLELSWRAAQTGIVLGAVTSVSLTIRNRSTEPGRLPSLVEWQCHLPDGLSLVSGLNMFSDSVLTGTVYQLLADTTIVFRFKAEKIGQYTVRAQITAATYGDPDSIPDSGLGDGEDDQAVILFTARALLADESGTGAQATIEPPAGSAGQMSVVYPNPASSVFTFRADSDVIEVKAFDMLGRERFQMNTVPQGQTVQFGQSLPDARYLLYIRYATGERRTLKLIKQAGFSE
jgi:parallel beta-helix repeat protein